MSLGNRLCLLVCSIALVVGFSPPLSASAATTTTLGVSAPAAYAGGATTVTVALTDDGGAPIADAPVVLERRTGGVWQPVGTLMTGPDGRATARQTLAKVRADNAVRATYAGDGVDHDPATTIATMPLKKRSSVVTVGGPRRVVDGRTAPLRIRWRTTNGLPVAGAVVVQRRTGGHWRKQATVRTGDSGRATLRVKPRSDSVWRVRAAGLDWVTGDVSPAHRIDNRPPGDPVKLPKGAPRPRRSLPAQAHAVGSGPNLAISSIPAGVWRQMTGRTWHSGCPVGRAQLRLVRVNYWDYSGYRRRGEIVANADAAAAMGAALAEMYRRDLPIRAMYRVDRFGWSKRSRGGDDYASMAAGNTSAFNCRDVTGRPGRRSPHAYGRSLDVNTWENPYRSAKGLVPNTWWQPRSHPRVAWRSRSHAVVKVMNRHGLRWTYGLGDTQHFDYVGSARRAMVAARPCDRFCD